MKTHTSISSRASIGNRMVFFAALKAARLPLPTPEFRFSPPRKWRADYCWQEQMVILEVEGGAWSHGRHTRGSGFIRDMEKYNAAACLGYRMIRVVPEDLCKAATMEMIRTMLSKTIFKQVKNDLLST